MAGVSKKREVRKSLRQPGWITLDGGFAARPCVVQDMSATGAKITIDDPNMLPAKLRLALSRDARTGRASPTNSHSTNRKNPDQCSVNSDPP